jgi:hypothetical protein
VSEDRRIVGREEWQGKVYDSKEWTKLQRTARNHRILHMPMECKCLELVHKLACDRHYPCQHFVVACNYKYLIDIYNCWYHDYYHYYYYYYSIVCISYAKIILALNSLYVTSEWRNSPIFSFSRTDVCGMISTCWLGKWIYSYWGKVISDVASSYRSKSTAKYIEWENKPNIWIQLLYSILN